MLKKLGKGKNMRRLGYKRIRLSFKRELSKKKKN